MNQTSIPPNLWVKAGQRQATRVSTENCEIVHDFIFTIKNHYKRQFADIDINDITLHIHEDADALSGDLALAKIINDKNFSVNDAKHPIIVKTLCRPTITAKKRILIESNVG